MYFFSTELRKLYLQWAKSEPGVAIADYYTLFSKLMDKPERYGFSRKYLKQGCIGRRCSDNWREYIWFDDVRLLSFSRRYLLAADDPGAPVYFPRYGATHRPAGRTNLRRSRRISVILS